jgi:carbamoyl-phosphate synthase large subunit
VEDITVLVTGAGGSASSNFVDALRLSGNRYRTVGVDASATHLHLATTDVRAVVPPARDARFGGALRAVVHDQGVAVVHAQPDPDVLRIGMLRDDLGGAATFLPAQETLCVAADKNRCAAVLAAAGVSVPETIAIEALDTAADSVTTLLRRHEKVWVRARAGAGSRAALPVRAHEQATAWIAWWVDERGLQASDFIVSEFLPGREFAYQSVWQDGELVAGQARERVEYLYGHLTPSGQTSTPAVARTVKDPRIDELAIQAVLAIDPRPQGAFCIDIKENAAGEPCVTEVNAGRFFTTSNFFAHAGLNMPDVLVRCALGERAPRQASSPLPADLYWIRMVDMGFVLVPGADLERWHRAAQ